MVSQADENTKSAAKSHPNGFIVIVYLSPGSDIATTPDKHLGVTSSVERLNSKIDESLLLLPFEMDLSMPLSPQY
jgi:hypothetical protein